MQESNFIEFNEVTGDITSSTRSVARPLASAGHRIKETIDFTDPDAFYVNIATYEVVAKANFELPAMPVSGIFSMAVPQGTLVKWLGDWYTINDGLLEIVIDQIGSFPLVLRHEFFITEYTTIENI